MSNPYNCVLEFEQSIAEWCGAPYAVGVESCTAAIFLSLMCVKRKYQDLPEKISIPCKTYPSTPCNIIHAGFKVAFNNVPWEGEYELFPLNIWDAALRFKKGMYSYNGSYQCLSFHIKKNLPIGRGGAILLDDEEDYEWLKKARFDGRSPVPLKEDNFTMLGWNAYMQPSDAARGIQLFEVLKQRYPEGPDDLSVEAQGYSDLSQFKIYQQ